MKHKMFITFGFGQTVGGYKLDDHYMVIDECDIPNVIRRNEAGWLVFGFRYPIYELAEHIDKWGLIEITQDEYTALRE